MDKFNFGDIVVLEFPFTDGKNKKKRPALVLFHDEKDNELLLARITSKIYQNHFDLELKNWQQSNLLLKSCVRLSKLATLHTDLVYKKLGKISTIDKKEVVEIIKTSINTFE